MTEKETKSKKYGEWTSENMERAIECMSNGDMGLNATAKFFGIPKATLSRHVKSQNKIANGSEKFHGKLSCLGAELEEELAQHCLELEKRFFGLTIDDLRGLAYEIAEANGIEHSFCSVTKKAGMKWYYNFMKRHPSLSLRLPESTSMARAQGFNRPRVEAFFELIEGIYEKYQVQPSKLYNMDETSLSTVQDGQRKIVGCKGKKQVGRITSQERGQSTTGVVCCNAAGQFIPPMVIYRRQRLTVEMTNGGPPGTLYSCQEKGWMSNEGFNEWLEHFIAHAHPSPQKPVILILDGHVSHTKNLTALTRAKEAGVVMVSLPPHCTHKLQPLDVAFFAPFKCYYNEAIRQWMHNHVGRPVTTWQVAELLNTAYGKAASVQNAMKGFEATGLYPLNKEKFGDADFCAAQPTDNPPHSTDIGLFLPIRSYLFS
jgi:hypothetical protein